MICPNCGEIGGDNYGHYCKQKKSTAPQKTVSELVDKLEQLLPIGGTKRDEQRAEIISQLRARIVELEGNKMPTGLLNATADLRIILDQITHLKIGDGKFYPIAIALSLRNHEFDAIFGKVKA